MKTVRLSIAIQSHKNDAQFEKETGIPELIESAKKRLRFVERLEELYADNLDSEVSVKTLVHIWKTIDEKKTYVLEYWWRYADNEKEFDDAVIEASSLKDAVIECRKIDRRIFAIYHNRVKVL